MWRFFFVTVSCPVLSFTCLVLSCIYVYVVRTFGFVSALPIYIITVSCLLSVFLCVLSCHVYVCRQGFWGLFWRSLLLINAVSCLLSVFYVSCSVMYMYVVRTFGFVLTLPINCFLSFVYMCLVLSCIYRMSSGCLGLF